MNIVMAGQNFRVTGGSDRLLLDELELLNSKGHVAVPFAAKHPENLPTPWDIYFPDSSNFDRPGLSDAIRFIYNPSAAASISKLLHNFDADLVHCHIYYGKLTGSILGEIKNRGIPIVQTLHEYKIVCPVYTLLSQGELCDSCSGFKFYNSVIKRCNRGSLARSALSAVESYTGNYLGAVSKVDHFVAVSDFLRNKVIDMGVPAEKVTTVYNFTDVGLREPDFSTGGYYLYFGRIEEVKGIWTLVKAFEVLRSLKLVVAGTGALLKSLQDYVDSRGLSNISVVGFKNKLELAELIDGCICTICPSTWYETFGLTVVESFARGKPAIVSDIGGIPEVVEKDVDAFVVPPGDVEALIDAVERMGVNANRAVGMGVAARANVVKKFSREVHYENLMKVYEGLVS